MFRRTVLQNAAVVAGLGLAGCTADSVPGNGSDTGIDEPPIELVDSTFAVRAIDHTGKPTADVAVHDGEKRVRFTGTIEGSDGCKTAVMEAMQYDTENDGVYLAVGTENRKGTEGQACTEALVYVDYEATAQFENGTPKRAAVSHDGEEILRVPNEGAQASDGN